VGFFLEALIGGLMTGMLYSLVALGFVLIFKASGVFNFAQGAMVLFAALAMARFAEWFPALLGFDHKVLANVLAFVGAMAMMVIVAWLIERNVLGKLVNQEGITLLMATLGERPSDQVLAAERTGRGPGAGESKSVDLAGLGLKVAPLSPDLREKFQLNGDQKGVVVVDVANGGSGAEKGLKPGDVIVEVQQKEVATPADVQRQVEAARKADRKFVLMLIQGQEGTRYVPLSLAGKGGGKG